MKRRYTAQQNVTDVESISPDFVQVMANEMKHYSESHDLDTISRVHGELDELKNIMVKNVGKFNLPSTYPVSLLRSGGTYFSIF